MIKTIILDEAKVNEYFYNLEKSKKLLKENPIQEPLIYFIDNISNEVDRFLETTKIKTQ